MSGILHLDWAALAISLHNTILLLWLGITVLLNADRRTWGITLAGTALLLASLFFVSHSVILVLGLNPPGRNLDFWWHLSWIPVVLLPFSWYLVTLWYTGFWEGASPLTRRQRACFFLAVGLTLGLAVLFALSSPLPSLAGTPNLEFGGTPEVFGMPVLLLVYVGDILLCILLSLDALRHPGPSARMMGAAARERARPWLMATSLVLLIVGLLAGGAIVWLTMNAPHVLPPDPETTRLVASFDLVVEALIAISILLVGQAVARYEVFTGKTLPRGGLMRHWRSTVVLAAGYGTVLAGALTLQLRPIYIALSTMLLMTTFHALFSWRSFVERDRYIRHLRPFLTSQHLYERLVGNVALPSDIDIGTPLRALCLDVLGARVAHLQAIGPLAPLVPILVYPEGNDSPSPAVDLRQFDTPQKICIPLDPGQGGFALAIPLWSERGLIGLLSVGEKSDGGLYTQEEIEIARATGERLVDSYASAELGRQLMSLQRRQWQETRLLDHQARRVLHDEVLPRLHAAMIGLSNGAAGRQALDLLVQAHRQAADLLHDMPKGSIPQIARQGLVGALRQLLDEEWAQSFESVEWLVEPKAETEAGTLPPVVAETLFHAAREAIRNSARYGKGDDTGRELKLRVRMEWQQGLGIVIEDDGVGLQVKRDTGQGGGQGLALHSAMLALVGGSLSVESNQGQGTRVLLSAPAGTW